jgi:hypothetical protein
MPITAQSATDLKFRESHFAYSQEALANAQKEVKVIDINVSMNNTSARVLFLKDPNDKSSFPADFKISGEKFSGRIKSFGSSTRALKKKSIILKIKGSTWQGHKKLSLRSMASDGSLMREWMAWELMRDMGMMVPDTFYVRLNINGKFIGYYLYIEWLGKHFLEKRGYNASSELYQPDDSVYCGDFRHGSKMKRCWMKLSPQGGDYSSMETLASKIKSTPPKEFDQFVTDNFEDDSLTNWIAVNTLTSQGDTYNKNYFLIKSGKTKKWKVIPWDYDLTFGQSFDMFVKFPETIFNERFQYYYTPDQGVFNPLKAKTLLNEKLKAKFYTRLEHLIGKEKNGPEKTYGWFSPTVMNARVENLARVLEVAQMKQKYGARSPESFIEQYDAVAHYGIVRPFFLEANLFSTFVWDYKHTDQMKEHVAWTKGQDLFPAYHPKANLADADQLAKPIKEHEPVGESKKALERRVFMEKLLEKPFTGRAASADFGASLIVFDPGWGYFLARLDFREPFQITDFQSEAEAFRPPMYTMEGANLEQCIQRSWILFTRIPSLSMKTNVTFEYFDEHSQRNELAGIKNEHAINLWVNTGEKWQPLITEVNAKANTLTVRDFQLNAGRVYRFVGCLSDKPKLWSKPISR